MKKSSNGPKRVLPAERGERNDPNRREESAQQPGVSTMSTDKNIDSNEDLTETASENFREESFGEDADPGFDEIGNRDNK